MKKTNAIRPGEIWYDNNGRPIQAHGGGILYSEMEQKYYWYGEDKTEDNMVTPRTQSVPVTGVHCYSSKDLYQWTDEGIVLPVFNNPQFVDGSAPDNAIPLYVAEDSPLYRDSPLADYAIVDGDVPDNGKTKSPTNTLIKHNSPQRIEALNLLYAGHTYAEKKEMYLDLNWNKVMERPKVIYNKATGQYVMWWHHDGDKAGDYWLAEAGLAVSDSPTGPFRYISTQRLPNTLDGFDEQGMLRDMTLFVDDDQRAYIIYASEQNKTTIVMLLDETYTKPAANEAGECLEGVHWKRIHSSNREAPAVFKQEGVYYMITSGLTGWSPNPARYHVSETGMLGNWVNKGNPCVNDFSRTTFHSQSTYVLPYRDAQGNVVKDQFIFLADRWNPHNLKDSRYVWLPLQLNSEKKTIQIGWFDTWKLDEIGSLTIRSKLPAIIAGITGGLCVVAAGILLIWMLK